MWIDNFIGTTISLVTLFVTAVYQTGWPALLSGSFITITGGWLGRVYLKAQLPIRREMSNAKAPMMSSVGTALNGLSESFLLFCLLVSNLSFSTVSIRAYGSQEYFRVQLRERVDNYVRAALTFYNINRCLANLEGIIMKIPFL